MAASMSLLDTKGAGIGNYKGVMLCNRPFAGTKGAGSGAGGGGGGGGTKEFKAGVIPEPLGMAIPLSAKDRMKLQRPKKETVLTKHRKWLADLQRTKDSLEIQLIDEMNKKAESIQKFQDQEKKMRKIAKELLRAEEKAESKGDSTGPETTSSLPSPSSSSSSPPKAEAKSSSSKPAWALTEKLADAKIAAAEEKEFNDEEGLLDFAAGLNYDRFIEDVEVKTLMANLAQRIAQLESEVKEDSNREMDAEERKARRELLAMAISAQANAAAESAASGGSDVYAAARAVLADDEEMSAVHSKRSVAAMLASAKEKIAHVAETVKATKAAELAALEPKEARVTGGPVIVVHEPSEGTRIDGKQTVSNLPYQHRNPAI
jgi:hypothetical protein